MKDADSLKPLGKAWCAIVRVRLFHSRLRHRLRDKGHSHAVINQLHLIATLLGFADNPLSICSRLLEIPVTAQESADYLMVCKGFHELFRCK